MAKQKRGTTPSRLARDFTVAERSATIVKRFLDLAVFSEKIAQEHKIDAMRESAAWFEKQAKAVQEHGLGAIEHAHFVAVSEFQYRVVHGVEQPINGKLVDWLKLMIEAQDRAQRRGKLFDLRSSIDRAKEAIENGQHAMEEFTNAASKDRKNVATAATLMLVNITRAETIEGALREQAAMLMDYAGRPEERKRATAKFVALGDVINTRRGPESELRCVRIGSAHAYYQIHTHDGDWSVNFEFPTKDFTKQYTRVAFEALTDRYYLFYELVLTLLIVHELLILLADAVSRAPAVEKASDAAETQ